MRKFLFLITLLSVLQGMAQDFKYGRVSKEELEEKVHPKFPDANAAILFRDNYSHFNYNDQDGFILVTEVQERIKIYNTDGFKNATKRIKLYKGSKDEENVSGLYGVTYTLENGKVKETKLDKDGIFKEEQDKYSNVLKFTMPNLSAGAVIEYKYTVHSPYLGNLDEVRFQERIPLNKAEARYYFPEYFGFKMHSRGSHSVDIDKSSSTRKINLGSTFKRSSNGGFTGTTSKVQNRSLDFMEEIYMLGAKDVPPMKEESFSGNLDNYLTAVKFELSYIHYPNQPFEYVSSTWEDVAKTIYDSPSFGGELSRSGYFDDALAPLLKTAKTAEAKINLIYEFVKQHMTWNSYIGIYTEEGLKQAYKKQSGNVADINLMLVAMLRHAGLEANPVLISSKSNGIPLFPTRNGFNYVVASVDSGDSRLLLDATSKQGEIDMLEQHLINWNGRLIREDGTSEWTSLLTTKPSTENIIVNIDLKEDLTVTAHAKNRFIGYSAMDYRNAFRGLSQEETRTKLEAMNNGIELSDIELVNLNALYEPVSLSYSFEPLTSLEQVGNKIIISPLFHLAMTENPFKGAERKYPIDFKYPRKERYIISIVIPEGYQVESLPESTVVNLFDGMGKFSYYLKENLGMIQLICEQAMNTAMMSPDMYTELKNYYTMIVEKEQEKIILSKI
ncbi:transglutaminase domain-containing protein [Flavimarina sp. Hel_I_48]|uniref:transglutaminase domain-containing protein n=1 Tax=Flavimarina sp. Hel_I_48 TaxID=1392488 RepID=UPI0004DED5C9|nr:DUF3857 domain-containing protein [Flavimarina sp. Hel_I_48]